MEKVSRRGGIAESTDLKTNIRKKLATPFTDADKARTEPSDTDEKFTTLDFEFKKGGDKRFYIISLFPKKLFAELYFAWCKDCSENISVENAKYFRDELLLRKNKDLNNFDFQSLRVAKNFLLALIGNIEGSKINKLNLSDNLITDISMHNIKNLISVNNVIHLNLASNMISTEGLKIIQNELITSTYLKYLNLGIKEGSFRRNNFAGEGGLILARILLSNESLDQLILEDNELGDEGVDKIGSALIKNKHISKLKISDNKLELKGAKSIIENGDKLTSLDLSNNNISPEISLNLKFLLETSKKLNELIWNSNNLGLKGIKNVVEGIRQAKKLKFLSLQNTNLGDSGAKILADGLRFNSILQKLDISSNSITYESFIHICDAITTNKITTFRASNNILGDESIEYFAKTIMDPDSTANLTSFDFSSCKIYDQGLIHIVSKLVDNQKLSTIKLRDNYFSHEVDYVVIDFLEKNTTIKSLDLTKNRFSFQFMQRVEKIIERNIQMLNNKEPTKLLMEVYRLKYENRKLNEIKQIQNQLEIDVEKLRSNKNDIRQDYETFKSNCDEEHIEYNKIIEKNSYLLQERKKEFDSKSLLVETLKKNNETNVEALNRKLGDLKLKKNNLEEDNKIIKNNTEIIEREYLIKIEQVKNKITENKRKEMEYLNTAKSLTEELMKLDKMIKEIQSKKSL